MIDTPKPNPLDAVARRAVRSVARSNGPAAEALFTLAAGQRKDWTLADWRDVLASLDACSDTVEFYRTLHE